MLTRTGTHRSAGTDDDDDYNNCDADDGQRADAAFAAIRLSGRRCGNIGGLNDRVDDLGHFAHRRGKELSYRLLHFRCLILHLLHFQQ